MRYAPTRFDRFSKFQTETVHTLPLPPEQMGTQDLQVSRNENFPSPLPRRRYD